MRVLHTSDWHLGRCLYGRKRYEEFTRFLDWLIQTIVDEQVDILLVAGDIFDTGTPTNKAQELYYQFLVRISTSCCRHVVVIGGNHDSPSFLNAPKELLRVVNVHVVGSTTEVIDDEVIVLYKGNIPEAIVCAVPYLRDKDIRSVEPGETIDDKNIKLVEGIRQHYATVCQIAEKKQTELHQKGFNNIPIIGMGHLFTSGGKTVDGDGVRELYVGSLAHVGIEIFPAYLDYVALGHLHIPQQVGGTNHIRYSGSPIPMGYGEASHTKKVLVVEFTDTIHVRELTVPCFQQLVRITGNLDTIYSQLDQLKTACSCAWLEIEYTDTCAISNIRELLEEKVNGSALEILRIKNQYLIERIIHPTYDSEALDDLNNLDIFYRCLDAFEIPEEDRDELIVLYKEIVQSLHEEDSNAE